MLKPIKTLFLGNYSPKQTVLKNTFWLTVSEVVIRILKSILVLGAIHILAPEAWGAFSYVFATATLLGSFSEFGSSGLITKHVTHITDENKYFLGTLIGLKIIAIICIFIFILFAQFFSTIHTSTWLYVILAFTVLGYSTRELFLAFTRAREAMQVEALIKITDGVLSLIFGALLLSLYRNPFSLALGYLAGSLGGLLLITFLSRGYGIRSTLIFFDKKLIPIVLREVGSIGLLALFNTIILNLDIIILGHMRSEIDVGMYAAAQRIVQFVYVIPSLVMTALFPVFVRIARVSLFDLGQKGIRIMANLATLFLPFVAIFIILAKPLIETLFGAQYLPMIPTLTFLCLSTLFTFSNIILIGISVTSSRQGALVYSYIWGVVINILLNITFIYNLGVLGSALAVIVTQAVILMISIYKLSVGTLSHWMRAHILHLFFFPSILLLSLISHTKQSTSLLVGMWVLYVSFLILSKKNRHELRAIMHEMSGNYSRLKSR